VYRFVLRLVRNEATAEDLISEVFLDIWRQAGKFEGRSAASTWMLSIARFKALSTLRGRSEDELDDETAERIEDHADDPDALQRRFRLTRIESQRFQLSNTTLYRWRIPDRRSVATVVRSLEGDRLVASAQPNYLFALQEDQATAAGDPAQYSLAKLRLPQAHALAKGANVLVAVIDSGVEANHPDLAGSVAETFDAIPAGAPHKHGTAIAGLIAAHRKLLGAAPGARILAVRAFDPKEAGAEGTTFNILKGIDWAAARGANVINISFAGPPDPAIRRSLEAARRKGIVLIAAAGNAGANSPPLYPAADPNVIAVTSTDANDKLFEQASGGRHIALAAPGTQILVAIPDNGYEMSSGTSYSAAEVSGIVALMLQRKPGLTPDQMRSILRATARDLGPKGPDVMYGAGLANAYGALVAETAPPLAAGSRPVERASAGVR
jgi:subtilisin family serine protease